MRTRSSFWFAFSLSPVCFLFFLLLSGLPLQAGAQANTPTVSSRPDVRWMQSAHVQFVSSVAYSSNGQMVASAGGERTIKIWTAGRLLYTLVGHLKPVNAIAFSPDCKTLVSGSEDGTVKWWRMADGTLLGSNAAHDGAVTALAFSPDGKWLASAGTDDTVRLWHTADGSAGIVFDTLKDPYTVAFSPDSSAVAWGGQDGMVTLKRLADGQLLNTFSTGFPVSSGVSINALSFAPDGLTLAASLSNQAYAWRIADAKLLLIFRGHTATINTIAYSPDGTLLATGSGDRTIRIWRANDATCVSTLLGHTSAVRSVAFSPDSKLLLSGGSDYALKLWWLPGSFIYWSPLGHSREVQAVAFSPDDSLVASCGSDGAAKQWYAGSGNPIAQLMLPTGSFLTAAAYAPDGTLALGGTDKQVRLWHLSAGQVVTLSGHTGRINALAYSMPDGQWLVSGSADGTAKLWRTSDNHLQMTFSKVGGIVYAVAFARSVAPGEVPRFATAGQDGVVRLWRVSDGMLLASLSAPPPTSSPIHCLAFSGDGKTLAVGSEDGVVRFWRPADAPPPSVIKGIVRGVKALAFAPDSRVIAVSGDDARLQVWRVADLTLLKTYDQETAGGVNDLRFSPEGSLIVGGRGDGTVMVIANPAFTPPLLTDLSVLPGDVTGGSLPGPLGRIGLSGMAPFDGTVVALSSSDPTVATVPASVTLTAKSTSITFPITTYAVTTRTTVTITAKLGAGTKSFTLTVTP